MIVIITLHQAKIHGVIACAISVYSWCSIPLNYGYDWLNSVW